MAFPTIATADTKNGTQTSNSSSWTLTYPTNLANGDLILAFVATDGAPTPTFPANWIGTTFDGGGAGANALALSAKISDGTETGTFTLSLSASEQGGWRIFRITGWFGSGLPSGTFGAQRDGNGMSRSVSSSGASTTPDPASLNPANWATEDTLWFAVMSADTSRTISVYPLANNQTADVSGGSGGATLGVCTTNSAVSSLNPGTFTISASDDWVAATVAVRPAAAAAALPPTRDPWPALQAVNRASVY